MGLPRGAAVWCPPDERREPRRPQRAPRRRGGHGLQREATVTYGRVPATGVSIDAMTGGLLSTVPPHAEGFVDIVVHLSGS